MRQNVFSCDVCHRQKEKSNHWYLIRLEDGNVTIIRWDEGRAELSYKHLCGQSCVQKFIEQWMGAR